VGDVSIARTGPSCPCPRRSRTASTHSRAACASCGLTFTDSDGIDLDEIYPNDDNGDDNDDDADDSTYDPTGVDDNLSYDSDDDSDDDDDSDYTPPNEDGDASTDSSNFSVSSTPDQPLPAPIPVELGGVNDTGDRNDDPRNTGVETKITETNEMKENDGIQNTSLKAYVNELENELDNEIVALDSDYSQHDSDEADDETDNAFEPMDEAKGDEICADAAREQASDDAEMPKLHHRHNDDWDSVSDSENEAPDQPLNRLRRKRTPNYGHLKGRDGDGLLPTVARLHEFGGGKHQSHVILQSIIMTQYNLKQGVRKFGDKGKEAVLTELQQLYDRDVMTPVNKYDLTPEKRKGALRYLMF
jgi:hypothetical protein